jgi:hypothetical protein
MSVRSTITVTAPGVAGVGDTAPELGRSEVPERGCGALRRSEATSDAEGE